VAECDLKEHITAQFQDHILSSGRQETITNILVVD
jgi:hypothetical protein